MFKYEVNEYNQLINQSENNKEKEKWKFVLVLLKILCFKYLKIIPFSEMVKCKLLNRNLLISRLLVFSILFSMDHTLVLPRGLHVP